MQVIDYNPKKLSPSMLLSSATHIYHTPVLQFKNASWVTDKYLVGETVLLQVVQRWRWSIQLTVKKFVYF